MQPKRLQRFLILNYSVKNMFLMMLSYSEWNLFKLVCTDLIVCYILLTYLEFNKKWSVRAGTLGTSESIEVVELELATIHCQNILHLKIF